MSAPREQIVRALADAPPDRLRLETLLDGASCITDVFAAPVLLTLDGAVRDALVEGRGDLAAVPASVRGVLEALRGRALSAGVHRFRLEGLVPLAAAFGHAYVTVAASTATATATTPDETIVVDDTVAVADGPEVSRAARSVPVRSSAVVDDTIAVPDEPASSARPRSRVSARFRLTPRRIALLLAAFVVGAVVAYVLVRVIRG